MVGPTKGVVLIGPEALRVLGVPFEGETLLLPSPIVDEIIMGEGRVPDVWSVPGQVGEVSSPHPSY